MPSLVGNGESDVSSKSKRNNAPFTLATGGSVNGVPVKLFVNAPITSGPLPVPVASTDCTEPVNVIVIVLVPLTNVSVFPRAVHEPPGR